MHYWNISAVQFSSVAQSCPTLCDPMNRSTPGLPVHRQLPEFTQTHVHCIGDAIQPSHLLSSPSPPAFNLSQHQGLFQWVSSSNQVAKVLEFQFQHQSFQWLFWFPLGWRGWISLQSKELSHGPLIVHQTCIFYGCILDIVSMNWPRQIILSELSISSCWKSFKLTDRCLCWSSNTLATWCEELTHWKTLWCWERLKARGEGDDRGQDG